MKQFQGKILSNRSLCNDTYEMTFEWAPAVPRPQPGQFLTVRVAESSTPLLRRPFALCGYDADSRQASMIYLRRGPATALLVAKEAGEMLDVIGPLGNCFPSHESGPAILVAGGIGLGPMLYLKRDLDEKGKQVVFVFGARTKELVPDFFSDSGDVVVCTDDGSVGFHGTTVDFLNQADASSLSGGTVYCCGPTPMLKACHEFAGERAMGCYVSMEQIMACGVGACMGCVIKVRGGQGYARVCKEGSIFDAEDILWT